MKAEKVKFSCPETFNPKSFKLGNYDQGNFIHFESENKKLVINIDMAIPTGSGKPVIFSRYNALYAWWAVSDVKKFTLDNVDLTDVILGSASKPECIYEFAFSGLRFKDSKASTNASANATIQLEKCTLDHATNEFECDRE